MTVTAVSIITDAYERMNRLSPGETLGADDAAFGLRRLNLLVDELSAENLFLFRDILTSAAQTGHITLGTGSWAAVPAGAQIISATATATVGGTTAEPMSPLTMEQYNALSTPADTGAPIYYSPDGLSTVYLYPVATGQTVKLQTRIGVAEFADQTTAYTVPPGYKAYLGAALAVRVAPALLGRLPPELIRAETQAMNGISKVDPAIVDTASYAATWNRASILNGP